jgi:hypothetical protein
MRRFSRVCGVAVALALLVGQANAARLYFTTSSTAGAPKMAAPEVSLEAGETTTLFVWVDLNSDGTLGDGPDQWMAGYGVNIVATTPGVVEAISSQVTNPDVVIPQFGNAVSGPRWTPANVDQPILNPDGSGGLMLAFNAGAFGVNTAGATGIAFTGQGVKQGQPVPFPMLDRGYDPVNDVFLAQTIELRALPGAGNRSTGIVLQVGPNAFSVDNNPAVEPIYFGAGQVPVPNNAVGATDITAGPHAMIVVGGPPPPGRDILRFNADAGSPATIVVPGPTGGEPVNIPVGASAGIIRVEDWTRSFFDVFFDITPSDGNTIDSILAALNDQDGNGDPTDGYTASLADLPDDLGLGIDYDIRVRYPVLPGSDVTVDFDLGTMGTVANIGIPEPSTLVLAAVGGIALVALRRRRK